MNLHDQQELIIRQNVDPAELEAFKRFHEMMRVGNSMAASKSKDMRRLGTIPLDVYLAVKKIDPDLVNDKKRMINFFKRFKMFAAPEKF